MEEEARLRAAADALQVAAVTRGGPSRPQVDQRVLPAVGGAVRAHGVRRFD